jgi:predicted ATPase
MRPDLPTGTVTLLFTDVEGSTRLLHELGSESYANALAEHRRVIREVCAAEGGVEVDTQGDAFFFAFPTAPGAVAAASAFTEALSSGPIQVRVGLHTGAPLLGDEGYVGDDVHFAARVAASAHGGQVVLSAATAERVELLLTDLGEHRLKDIDEPVAISQLGAGSFPPLKTISNTNLPRPASSFLGREAELTEVLARIGGGARLLTLSGPGGTGKTRLALEAATSLVGQYKAGVFWVGLASLRDPSLVTETIAQTLGAKDGLALHIADRELLLLLDNLEQVIEAARDLSTLLQSCPNLTLIVTSRELLRISGEVEYAVPPLAEPEAVALFCARSQLEPSAEIAELCSRLDSLPLAVELAAARTKVLTPGQILERLSDRLDLLTGGRDADPRQQTLRATIEWSYDLLTPAEQQLFARLSIFAGGCTPEAAEDVAGADLDALQSLVEKSLLRFSNERYWMLETIRELAGERLVESGELERLRSRHIEHLLAATRSTIAAGPGPLPRDWPHRFEPERANLRDAMTWALAADRVEDACVLAIAYGFLCRMQGPLSEGRSWLRVVLEREGHVGDAVRQRALRVAASLAEIQRDHEASLLLAEQSLALARSDGDPSTVAAALLALGVAEGSASNFQRAESLEREALAMFEASGDERQVRQTLGLLAWVTIARGDYAQAQELCERALRISRADGDDRGVVIAVGNLGHSLAKQGRFDEALPLQLEALRLARDNLDIGGVADTLVELATLAVACGQYEESAVLLGASGGIRTETQSALDTVGERLYQDALATLRAELQTDDLAAATARGLRMSLDEIVEYALASLD